MGTPLANYGIYDGKFKDIYFKDASKQQKNSFGVLDFVFDL